MKRYNSTVKHLLEVKWFKESTTTSSLWYPPRLKRDISLIDRIDGKQIQPKTSEIF